MQVQRKWENRILGERSSRKLGLYTFWVSNGEGFGRNYRCQGKGGRRRRKGLSTELLESAKGIKGMFWPGRPPGDLRALPEENRKLRSLERLPN